MFENKIIYRTLQDKKGLPRIDRMAALSSYRISFFPKPVTAAVSAGAAGFALRTAAWPGSAYCETDYKGTQWKRFNRP